MQVGSNYFRIHPKGVGLLCAREQGLPPLTFVEEYLGEVHAPWRWFEMQVGRTCLTENMQSPHDLYLATFMLPDLCHSDRMGLHVGCSIRILDAQCSILTVIGMPGAGYHPQDAGR